MTDVHCHIRSGGTAREIVIGEDFFGTHPWQTASFDEAALRQALTEHPTAGVGEIGLDRLKNKTISAEMRSVFERQLVIAAEFGRVVTLHGAKCWGEVVRACLPFKGRIPAFLFHGFSRSNGLIPDIIGLNGYISVGPAVLNDHAVNYQALVREIPCERLLLETDRTEHQPGDEAVLGAIAAKVAALRGLSQSELESITDQNARKFY